MWPLGVNGGEGPEGGSAFDPVSEKGGAGQSMRAAAGAADDTKRVNFESVGDVGGIVSRVANAAATLPIRIAITRPVVADEPDAEPVEDYSARPWSNACTRCAVELLLHPC
jgi:hypothetical protein